MRGVFLRLCLSILQLKQSCSTRTPDEGDISELMFIYFTIEAVMSLQDSCPTRTPDERGISEVMFIYLTTKAVMFYQDTR